MTTQHIPGDHLARQLAGIAASLDELHAARNTLIRELHDLGWSLREIAEVAAITHAGVRKILRTQLP